MIIRDYTKEYEKYILGENDLPSYEKVFPELFNHYFAYWADRAHFHATLQGNELGARKALVLSQISSIEEKIGTLGLDISAMRLILFVGQDCTNGHAFKYKDDFITWIPIEAYHTTKQASIFITHEILHALHYTHSPDLYFTSNKEKNSFVRQLLTEGVATYLTKRTLDLDDSESLWADYIDTKSLEVWMNWCRGHAKELYAYARQEIAQDSHRGEFFQANDPGDMFQYRAGYFVALHAVESIVRAYGLTPRQLIELSREDLEKLLMVIIKKAP